MDQQPRPSITHVGIYCSDVAASIEWYQDVLQMDFAMSVPGRLGAMRFGDAEHEIFLMQAPENHQPPTPMIFDPETLDQLDGRIGSYHMSIDMKSFDAVMGALRRALARGSEVGKSVHHAEGMGFYVRDPDSNLVELFVFDGQTDEADIAASVAKIAGHDGQGGGATLDARQTYQIWLAQSTDR